MTTPPAIEPHAIYSGLQLMRNLAISPDTLTCWCEFNGLRRFKPGTRNFYFLGSDVIDFIVSHPNGVINPKTAKAKQAARKGGSK